MTEEEEAKQRDRDIAHNEEVQQTTGDIRVSTWAIAIAILVGVVVTGWLLLYMK